MGWWLSRCSAWNYCLIEIIKLIQPCKISCICAGTRDKEDAGGTAGFQKNSHSTKTVSKMNELTGNMNEMYSSLCTSNQKHSLSVARGHLPRIKSDQTAARTTPERSSLPLLELTTHLCQTPEIAHSRLLQLSMTRVPCYHPWASFLLSLPFLS